MSDIIHKIRTFCKGIIEKLVGEGVSTWYGEWVETLSVRLKSKGKALGIPDEQHAQELLKVCIVVMVGLTGYGLGALSHRSTPSFGESLQGTHGAQTASAATPLVAVPHLDTSQRVAYTATSASSLHALQTTSSSGTPPPVGGTIVASKNSSKYHYLWCPGAKRIAQKNRRYFTNKVEAEKAGLSLAGNCK